MVFDFEKAMEDRLKTKEDGKKAKEERRREIINSANEKREEKTYGILFMTEDGGSFPDYEKGVSPEQAFSAALQRIRLLDKKIVLEKSRVKDYETGELFNHQGGKIE